MADMQKHNPKLVEEASLVSREMIKVRPVAPGVGERFGLSWLSRTEG